MLATWRTGILGLYKKHHESKIKACFVETILSQSQSTSLKKKVLSTMRQDVMKDV
jgi:hypothetical protein